MPDTDVEISELLEFDATRVDAVGSPANGTEWLILKALDGSETVTDTAGALAEIEKADDDGGDKPDPCPLCNGEKTIKQGHVKCPKCLGTGVAPKVGQTEKELAEAAKAAEAGVAASGADVPVTNDCPTCNGGGTIADGTDDGKTCPDCDGSGKDAKMPDDDSTNAVNGDPGKITEGAGGRETVDKATVSTADQNDLPDSAFAYIEPGGKMDKSGKTTPRSLRHFPIMDAAHVRNALARAPQSPFGDKAMPAIKAAAKKFDIEVGDASKAAGDVFTAPNPALADAASQVTDVDPDTTGPMAPPATPGSPAWEAVDAQTCTDAALALMTAVELMRTFASREGTEVAMGEGNDVFDAYAATEAICAAQQALGIVAQLAFHEGLEAAKSLPDDESVEKAGRRLAGKTVAALAAARDKAKDLADHIGGVLGDDDPSKKTDASKSADEIDMDALSKELENMSTDELTKVLDARDEKLVGLLAEALKGAPVKDAKKSKKDKAPAEEAAKADSEDAEVVDAETDEDAVAEPADDATKAELTPEEIEANEAADAAKKEAKRLRKAAEQAAENAKVAKAIEEAVAKATTAVDSLKEQLAEAEKASEARQAKADERLATVEKMAAPSTIVRTAPTEAQNVAKSRDETELRIATLENEARTTTDPAIRSGNRDIIKELRAELAAKN